MTNTATITASNISDIVAGEEFEIIISINNQSGQGIQAADLFINYDPTKADLLKVSTGAIAALGSSFVPNTSNSGRAAISWASGTSIINGDNGELLVLRFKSAEGGHGNFLVDIDEGASSFNEGELTLVANHGIVSFAGSTVSISGLSDSSVAENTAYASATPSVSGAIGAITWSLEGDDASLFSVNQTTGVVSMVAKDFESPLDTGKNNSYAYTLRATDTNSNTAAVPVVVSVTDQNDQPTGSVGILGIATQGQTLTADTSELADQDGLGEFTYQWKADGNAIPNSNSSTYLLTQDEVNKAISISVSYIDGGETLETIESSATAKTKDINDLPEGVLAPEGYLVVGKTLFVVDSLTDLDGLNPRSYTWQRSTDSGANWTDITTQDNATDQGYGLADRHKCETPCNRTGLS